MFSTELPGEKQQRRKTKSRRMKPFSTSSKELAVSFVGLRHKVMPIRLEKKWEKMRQKRGGWGDELVIDNFEEQSIADPRE